MIKSELMYIIAKLIACMCTCMIMGSYNYWLTRGCFSSFVLDAWNKQQHIEHEMANNATLIITTYVMCIVAEKVG